MDTLANMAAFVTDVSRGIGRAAAVALAAAGAHVIVHYRRGTDGDNAVADQIPVALWLSCAMKARARHLHVASVFDMEGATGPIPVAPTNKAITKETKNPVTSF
jgi:NAD(P)-dependent dehydrogenase (short-subunit alcohol dehydrogenase family)